LIGINSNDSTEYPDDSFENMKKIADEKGIKFDYLVDEKQDIAKSMVQFVLLIHSFLIKTES